MKTTLVVFVGLVSGMLFSMFSAVHCMSNTDDTDELTGVLSQFDTLSERVNGESDIKTKPRDGYIIDRTTLMQVPGGETSLNRENLFSSRLPKKSEQVLRNNYDDVEVSKRQDKDTMGMWGGGPKSKTKRNINYAINDMIDNDFGNNKRQLGGMWG